MPYIKQEQRPEMDKIVELMSRKNVDAGNDLEYILFTFCKKHISPSYNNFKNFRGELRESADEIIRRGLIPSYARQHKFISLGLTRGREIELYEIVELMSKKGMVANGDLNYILFKFCKYHINQVSRRKFVKGLEKCAVSIGKLLLAPYEDQKIKENGDV
jgi:hypothetical protein